jgi:hypothetical protein
MSKRMKVAALVTASVLATTGVAYATPAEAPTGSVVTKSQAPEVQSGASVSYLAKAAYAAKKDAARKAAIAKKKKAAAAKRAAEKKAAERRAAQKRASRSTPRTIKATPVGVAQRYAASLVPASQFGCLKNLWNRESGWSTTAGNPRSSAYGIPQALPGSKMASMGADWRTNHETQIKWGLKYIKGRYGTPCSAWSAFLNKGWY